MWMIRTSLIQMMMRKSNIRMNKSRVNLCTYSAEIESSNLF